MRGYVVHAPCIVDSGMSNILNAMHLILSLPNEAFDTSWHVVVLEFLIVDYWIEIWKVGPGPIKIIPAQQRFLHHLTTFKVEL